MTSVTLSHMLWCARMSALAREGVQFGACSVHMFCLATVERKTMFICEHAQL